MRSINSFRNVIFVYVHTPLITGQDCEGAGEMFQVTTMDLNKIAEEGKVDYEQDFFKKPVSLTVSGQLAGETFAQAFRNIYTFWDQLSELKIPIQQDMQQSSG